MPCRCLFHRHQVLNPSAEMGAVRILMAVMVLQATFPLSCELIHRKKHAHTHAYCIQYIYIYIYPQTYMCIHFVEKKVDIHPHWSENRRVLCVQAVQGIYTCIRYIHCIYNCPFLCLSVRLSVCLSVHLSVCWPVCVSVCVAV